MKKLLFTLGLFIASFAFVACDDDDKVISKDDLPAGAQTFLQTHFSSQEVRRVEKDNDSYDVYLVNGFKIEFTLSGEWDDIDCRGGQGLPASIIALLPENIPVYIAENYPNQHIVEVNKEYSNYEIDLNTNIELVFNTDGSFIRIDY